MPVPLYVASSSIGDRFIGTDGVHQLKLALAAGASLAANAIFLGFTAIDRNSVNTNILSATYGGVACTAQAQFTHVNGYYGRLFYLVNPPAGTNDFVVTYFDDNAKAILLPCIYSGVDQGTPFTSFTNDSGTTASYSASQTTNSGELAVVIGKQTTLAWTAGAGFTQREASTNTGRPFLEDASASAGSTTMLWSVTGGLTDYMSCRFGLRPAAAAQSADRGRTLARGLGRGFQ